MKMKPTKIDVPLVLRTLKAADEAYFNSDKPIMPDKDYDRLRDTLETACEAGTLNALQQKEVKAYLTGTGAAPSGHGKDVKLPLPIPSLDKIKTDEHEALTKRIDKQCKLAEDFDQEYLISPKLDGSSLTLMYDAKTLMLSKAYTRGDGVTGRDVTYHARILAQLGKIPHKWKKVSKEVEKARKMGVKCFFVRCELMIGKSIFAANWKGKEVNGKKLEEPRNSVNGWLISKTPNRKLARDLICFALNIQSKELPNGIANRFNVLQALDDAGFKTYRSLPGYARVPRDELGNSILDRKLNEAVAGPYECDGIVVELNSYVARHKMDNGAKRPIHSFAYKLSHNATEGQDVKRTTVTQVEWRLTKDGKGQPLVHYKPVKFGSTTNTKATGFNAKWIKENKIGVGAVIEVVRSGGVIPRIVRTITPAPGKILPGKLPTGEALVYKAPHLYLADPSQHPQVRAMQLGAALKSLGVEGVQGTSIAKLSDAGYTTLSKLVKAKEKDLAAVLGNASAKKFRKSLHDNVSEADGASLMDASSCFQQPGFSLGSTRAALIEKKVGWDAIIEWEEKKLRKKLTGVKGLGDAVIDCFISNLPKFRKWYARLEKTGIYD